MPRMASRVAPRIAELLSSVPDSSGPRWARASTMAWIWLRANARSSGASNETIPQMPHIELGKLQGLPGEFNVEIKFRPLERTRHGPAVEWGRKRSAVWEAAS